MFCEIVKNVRKLNILILNQGRLIKSSISIKVSKKKYQSIKNSLIWRFPSYLSLTAHFISELLIESLA